MGKYSGFESYLDKHEFTDDFIKDYEYWCKRIYWQWKGLQMEFDTFYEICWEALLKKISEFDPAISKIQTFCISRINNEAWRAYMKIKNRKPEKDCNSPVVENTVEAINEDEVMDSINDFARYCNKKGVSIDIAKFYDDYTECKENSAPLIVYAWWRAKNKEVGGRYDIQKTKRHING
jgi:hypothetical protein